MGKYNWYFYIQLCSVSLLLVSSLLFPLSVSAQDEISFEPGNEEWAYHQKLSLPISTEGKQARFQPIDMHISFKNPCWGLNETVHSIRVFCWNTSEWDELEVQIYNLEFSDESTVSSCNIVFLIPSYATGDETYYVFYDDEEKEVPDVVDHVHLFDKYYYFEPISGLSVEGDYYEIREDEEIVYGVGQKGRILNRQLSQIAIRMKPGTKKFDMFKTDLLASFCFAYQQGTEDADEVASDQKLVSKKVLVDGNLMVRFQIESKSSNNVLFTKNVYTYYYQPGEDKRISVRVHHEVKDNVMVSGEKFLP
ncbi:MAG: carboxypeptidase regulatory-like domain-containing protein, partial [Candidatus Thermoplasmatota archaeon]|nr:carboxypeptidase regulatory-like domain-containing protein [Candidatus Thermoplasmatota archaeon]